MVAPEKKKRRFRELYELLFADYRIRNYRISEKLGYRSVGALLEEAREEKYITGPEIRKLSYANTSEHVYFFDAEDPSVAYMKYRKDPRVVYNAKLYGFCNSLVISREEMNVDGEIAFKGPRSDYYMPFAPDQSWEKALQNMREKIEIFRPANYTPQQFIANHGNETVRWNDNDEAMYRYFKYDLKRKTGPLIKEQRISDDTVYYWFETLDKRCTICTGYYPETVLEYNTYIYSFETDYEDFVVELFSELPASPSFFKVSDKLILFAYLPKRLMKDTDYLEVNAWYIPLVEMNLLNKGIIKKKRDATIAYYRAKDF